ncbi:hypothetical protein N7U49_47165 [Streptomyces sp. AD2-2]|nr:hypothetical protein N7U49_47165 [Streptomyces sp. AD2-2]
MICKRWSLNTQLVAALARLVIPEYQGVPSLARQPFPGERVAEFAGLGVPAGLRRVHHCCRAMTLSLGF